MVTYFFIVRQSFFDIRSTLNQQLLHTYHMPGTLIVIRTVKYTWSLPLGTLQSSREAEGTHEWVQIMISGIKAELENNRGNLANLDEGLKEDLSEDIWAEIWKKRGRELCCYLGWHQTQQRESQMSRFWLKDISCMFSEELGGNEPGKHHTEQSLSNSLSPNHVVYWLCGKALNLTLGWGITEFLAQEWHDLTSAL